MMGLHKPPSSSVLTPSGRSEWEERTELGASGERRVVRLGTARTPEEQAACTGSVMASWVVESQQTRTEPRSSKHNHESEPVPPFEGPQPPERDISTRCSKRKWDRVCNFLSQRRSQMVKPCTT